MGFFYAKRKQINHYALTSLLIFIGAGILFIHESIKHVNNNCYRNLALWLLIMGIILIVVSFLLLINVVYSCKNRSNLLPRIVWFILYVGMSFWFIWNMVGTAWLRDMNANQRKFDARCPEKLYDFVFYVIIATHIYSYVTLVYFSNLFMQYRHV